MLYFFDAKHLEKGLNRGWLNFGCPFFKKVAFLANIRQCPNFLGYTLINTVFFQHSKTMLEFLVEWRVKGRISKSKIYLHCNNMQIIIYAGLEKLKICVFMFVSVHKSVFVSISYALLFNAC